MAKHIEDDFRGAALDGVRLFRDDLDQLCRLMGGGVQLIVGDMEYDSIDEIKLANGAYPSSLELRRKDPLNSHAALIVHFKNDCKIFAQHQDDEFYKCKDLLTSRIHHAWNFWGPMLPFISGLTLGQVALVAFFNWDSLNASRSLLLLLFLPLSYVCWLVHGRIKRSSVVLMYRHEHESSSWWSKHRDQLLLIVITAAVTIAVTQAFDYFTSPSNTVPADSSPPKASPPSTP